VWAELLIHIAPTRNAEAHKKCLGSGGKFITNISERYHFRTCGCIVSHFPFKSVKDGHRFVEKLHNMELRDENLTKYRRIRSMVFLFTI
jgi:hypothetical protein